MRCKNVEFKLPEMVEKNNNKRIGVGGGEVREIVFCTSTPTRVSGWTSSNWRFIPIPTCLLHRTSWTMPLRLQKTPQESPWIVDRPTLLQRCKIGLRRPIVIVWKTILKSIFWSARLMTASSMNGKSTVSYFVKFKQNGSAVIFKEVRTNHICIYALEIRRRGQQDSKKLLRHRLAAAHYDSLVFVCR